MFCLGSRGLTLLELQPVEATTHPPHAAHEAHAHAAHDTPYADHHELPFWRKYILATDHKMIGYQYLFTGLTFLAFGFGLMMLMRWQLAYPGKPLPIFGDLIGKLVGTDSMSPTSGVSADFYNTLGAMHGTIMVFLGIVPIAFGAFGNFVVPLQIGAPDMAFPKVNAASYWALFVGGVVMFVSFFVPGGAAKAGWTSYSPLADLDFKSGQTLWLIGMIFLITSSLLGAINFLSTIIQVRAKGMSWMRLPFFVWAQFVTGFLLLLAFPPLEAAGVMQLMDRVAHTSFFLPSGLVFSGRGVMDTQISGGGTPLLWQHLFWFLGHPEVYVLILPGMGIVAEVIANNTRKPLWGYKPLVYSVLSVGFLSFIVWAHHMYMTGMGQKISVFFQTTTVLISVPSMIILTALIISLYGGSIRFNTQMCFALGFLPMFGIGGLTGLPLAFNTVDLYLHDTYYVIAHFHYIVVQGTIFALFAGVYHWFPKATGRIMNEFWGKAHFIGSFICMNAIFLPMFLQGMTGVSRRLADGGNYYLFMQEAIRSNVHISHAAWALAIFQIPFIINFFWSMRHGKKVGDNPWGGTTLEWATPSPPPHGNFTKPVEAYRGPYEYSVPGHPRDFTPQFEPDPVPGKA